MGQPEFTLAELVGYEDVEARSHEALASLVVHPKPELLNYINTYNQEPNTFVDVIEGKVIALMRLPQI